MTKNLSIIGGGPAGLYLAYLLQDKGFSIKLFDHRIPFEKPCGGGITAKAIDQFELLKGIALLSNAVKKFRFISPYNSVCDVDCNIPVYIISRKKLSEFQLASLKPDKVEIINKKVTQITKIGVTFSIQTENQLYESDFIVGADGAHGISRRLLGAEPFGKNRYSGIGYYIDGLVPDAAVIKFYKNKKGYLWVFPRGDHSSVGFFSISKDFSKKTAHDNVEEFLKTYYPSFIIDPEKYYSATIPLVWEWKKENIQGQSWALIGDAGGFVDTITGEGIYYSFKSAEYLAMALIENHPESFYTHCIPMLSELQKSAHIFPTFYQTWFTSAMISLSKRSSFLQQLLVKLIMGEQSYISLKLNLKKNIFRVAKEVVGSIFR